MNNFLKVLTVVFALVGMSAPIVVHLTVPDGLSIGCQLELAVSRI